MHSKIFPCLVLFVCILINTINTMVGSWYQCKLPGRGIKFCGRHVPGACLLLSVFTRLFVFVCLIFVYFKVEINLAS